MNRLNRTLESLMIWGSLGAGVGLLASGHKKAGWAVISIRARDGDHPSSTGDRANIAGNSPGIAGIGTSSGHLRSGRRQSDVAQRRSDR